MRVARRLFEAGRAQEALSFLERGNTSTTFVQGEPYDYATLKSNILAALGRKDEARETLWHEFASTLNTCTLEKVLELKLEDQRPEAHRRAVVLAEQHRSAEQGAYFLMQVNELERAARLVERRKDEISGSWYDALLKVAKALTESYPSQAWIIYRILLLDILDESRYGAYGHAARYLMQMERLAQKADLKSEQAEFVHALRQKHGRKSSFWAKARLDT